MKKSNDITSLNKIDKSVQESQEREVKGPQEAVKSQALGVLHSLQMGERPALSPENTEEAVGLLGNQNVLKIMETGAQTQQAFTEAAAEVDTLKLVGALSGPPDGPVCAMETLFGSDY